MKLIKRLLLVGVTVGMLSGCNLMEGIHQFSPEYRNPVPFSSNWWDKRRK